MRIAIIGAGECGIRATVALRAEGFDGSIDLVHGEAHEPYERPPLSKPGPDGLSLKSISGTADVLAANISIHHDVRATSIDRATKTIALSNDETLSYDRLLLATGASPRHLVIEGKEIAQARYLRTYDDAKALYDLLSPDYRLTIIGAGFIGLELAAEARRRGAPTTVIESAPRILGRAVPEDLAARIEARHRTAGVQFHIGHAIRSINAVRVVTLDDGTEIAGDILVAGIGSIPDTALAISAGLTIENGVAVNERLQTSDPDIFAAGDCCCFPHPLYNGKRLRLESWRAAQEQGAHVARTMLGSGDAYHAVPWFWSDQYDLSLQIAGLPSEGTKTVMRALDADSMILFHLDEIGRLVAASGLGPGNRVARDIRLAEMLIAKRACPDPAALESSIVSLKTMLATLS